MVKAKENLDIDFNYVEPASLADFTQYLDDYAAAGYDLVVAIGFDMETPLSEVAPNYPDTKFAVVDTVVDQPNVSSVLFNTWLARLSSNLSLFLASGKSCEELI